MIVFWVFLAILASYAFIGWCCYDFGYDRGWDAHNDGLETHDA